MTAKETTWSRVKKEYPKTMALFAYGSYFNLLYIHYESLLFAAIISCYVAVIALGLSWVAVKVFK